MLICLPPCNVTLLSFNFSAACDFVFSGLFSTSTLPLRVFSVALRSFYDNFQHFSIFSLFSGQNRDSSNLETEQK